MQYFGGKSRLVKDLVPIFKNYLKDDMYFIDAFAGSSKVSIGVSSFHEKVLAFDVNHYLIEMFDSLKKGWVPPSDLTKEEYDYIRKHYDECPALTAFAGFGCSFAGKWFGGYAKNAKGRNYAEIAYRSLLKDLEQIKKIEYKFQSFFSLNTSNQLIYCDPPYKGTTAYGFVGNFDNDLFWNKVRELSKDNIVLVSEYDAPDDFEIIWEKEVRLNLKSIIKTKNDENRMERLYKIKKS